MNSIIINKCLNLYTSIIRDPIFTLDLYGNFLKVNNAGTTLLGYQTNELLNQPYYSLIYEEDLEEMINAFHRVKRGILSL